ncbi:MAG: hypothetical protein HY275_16535 [Gemmatimonadetes bacterium]|nr:hypothetical protein [Gemmatimonadota bacterium]
MVTVTRAGDRLRFEIEGFDKVLALKGALELPLAHVTGARVDPAAAKGWWHGVGLGGTIVPGVVTAGTFYEKGRMAFYDVHHADHAIVVELANDDYDRLIVEVRDPEGTAKMINAAVAAR